MRRIQALVVVMSIVAIATASPIKAPSAELKAKQFVVENKALFKESKVSLAYVSKNDAQSQDAFFYVYNVGDDNGFVIITGDDRAVPVLGYTDSGRFAWDEIPDNLRLWLDYYKEAMQQIIVNDIHGVAPHSRPTDVIKPLVSTRWNQDWPYNSLCPTSGAKQCPTGCVATAMAQVMNYHRFPDVETAEIPSYYCGSIGKTIPALPATNFEWDKMKNSYDRNSSEESIMAVAKLMQYCGQAVEMEYSASSSGAQTFDLPWRLPQYFHYPETMHYVYHEGYSIAEWDSLLINELKTNGPILYTGYTTAWEGHAFVCDGYDGKGLYHINWGWGGAADGYYRISVLDASTSGIGGSSTSLRFTINQAVLLGMKTTGEDDFVAPEQSIVFSTRPSLGFGRQYSRDDVHSSFPEVKISGTFMPTSNPGYFGMGFALYDDDGQMLKVLSTRNDYVWPGYGVNGSYHMKELGKGIESGHFTIRPVYSEGGVWKLAKGAERHYVDMEVDSLEMRLTPVPKADFVVNDIRLAGKSLSMKITNNDEEYNGPIYVRKLMADGNEEDIAYEMVAIEPNTTRNISIYIGDEGILDLGNDVFYLSVDYYKGLYFYTNVYNADAMLSCDVDILNLSEDSTTIVGDRALCNVSVCNDGTGDYRHFFSLSLQNNDGKSMEKGFRKLLELKAGESETMSIELPINEYEDSYSVVATNYVGKKETVLTQGNYYEVAQGAYYWTADASLKTCLAEDTLTVPEDALAIHLRNAYTSNVLPNSNPNTLYLLDKSIPEGLSGLNVLNSDLKTGTIRLTDGYDYFVPMEISATSSVRYYRTFTEDEVRNWSTIVLPFAPSKIFLDGVSTDWCRSESDTEKDLWIQSVKSVEGNVLDLLYTDEIQPNRPYLIAVTEDVVGKTLEFRSGKTTLAPSVAVNPAIALGGYVFAGTNRSIEIADAYTLRDNEFVFDNNCQKVDAFRAYFTSDGDVTYPCLLISGPDITSDIVTINREDNHTNTKIYDIHGRVVTVNGETRGLPKGVYVIGRRKVVVR